MRSYTPSRTHMHPHTHAAKQLRRCGGREGRIIIHTGGIGTHHGRTRRLIRHGVGLWRGRGRRGGKKRSQNQKRKTAKEAPAQK